MLDPRDSAEADDARLIVGEYLAYWEMLARLAGLVKNLMQPLERDWIVRSMSEKRRDVVLVVDLHTVVWKREILEVGVESTEAATGSKIEKAMKTLQAQDEDGSESDGHLVERFVESLKSIGVGPGKEN